MLFLNHINNKYKRNTRKKHSNENMFSLRITRMTKFNSNCIEPILNDPTMAIIENNAVAVPSHSSIL